MSGVCECHNQVIPQISFEPFLFSSRDSGLGWNFICWIQWLHVMSKLDLLKWFFTFCHGKSPLNHHLGEYLFFFQPRFFQFSGKWIWKILISHRAFWPSTYWRQAHFIPTKCRAPSQLEQKEGMWSGVISHLVVPKRKKASY